MRIGIAGFLHESNTFSREMTTFRHFQEAFLHYGAELVPAWRNSHHELGGFIEGCERYQLELTPLIAASATPKGPVTTNAYEAIVSNLLERLQSAAPLDGLLLALHGAMVSEDHLSADSETLRRVRRVVGNDLPLIMSLDMHANVAATMIELPNATIVYRTYPHVDQRERGIECARLIAGMVRGEIRPVQAHCKLPLLIHIVQQYTGAGPMAEILREIQRVASMSGVLSASIAPGYIYADSPDMGVSIIVVTDGDRSLAKTETEHLARFVFDKRFELNATLPDVSTAVRRTSSLGGTVCLMDCGDNIGGGGPGDSTIIFDELLNQEISPVCAVLYDPIAARLCADRGVGQTISIEVGAKTDSLYGRPIPITGVIRRISDGRFEELEPRHGGARDYNQGLTSVVETNDGHTIVLNSLRVMPSSLQQLLSLGVEPTAYKVIIVKGVTAPRAAYDPIATHVITVDSPGVTQAGPESFTYHRRPRPLFPLDEISDWRPT